MIYKSYDNDIAPEVHRLEILSYHDVWGAHMCRVTDTSKVVLVDLFVDGGLTDETNESLIGKTVEVAYTHGFVWIASEPKIVEYKK